MDNASTRAQLLEHFLSFFMPEGILDFFELVWAESQSIDSRESKKDILYTGTLHMYLDEHDNRPRKIACEPVFGGKPFIFAKNIYLCKKVYMIPTTATKRKLIDIKQSVFDALSYEASKKRISLKRYIEEILEEASIAQRGNRQGHSQAVTKLMGSALPKQGDIAAIDDDRLKYILSK